MRVTENVYSQGSSGKKQYLYNTAETRDRRPALHYETKRQQLLARNLAVTVFWLSSAVQRERKCREQTRDANPFTATLKRWINF